MARAIARAGRTPDRLGPALPRRRRGRDPPDPGALQRALRGRLRRRASRLRRSRDHPLRRHPPPRLPLRTRRDLSRPLESLVLATRPGRGSTVTRPGRGSLRPPAASRCSARKLAARSFPRRPPAYVLAALVRRFTPLREPARALDFTRPCLTEL